MSRTIRDCLYQPFWTTQIWTDLEIALATSTIFPKINRSVIIFIQWYVAFFILKIFLYNQKLPSSSKNSFGTQHSNLQYCCRFYAENTSFFNENEHLHETYLARAVWDCGSINECKVETTLASHGKRWNSSWAQEVFIRYLRRLSRR